MTPAEFKAIRIKMKLTQSQMAEWLYLSDGRVIRNWESGKFKIPGSVVKCLELAGFAQWKLTHLICNTLVAILTRNLLKVLDKQL